MQRNCKELEPKLINDFSVNVQEERKSTHDRKLKQERNAKDFKRFFNSFTRAMKFGAQQKEISIQLSNCVKVF